MIPILRFFIRIALSIFFKEIRIINEEMTQKKGPLLIVANHPNSFLDAILIGSIFDRKLHYLARGDVFRKPLYGYLLRSIGMIPIFRQREGKEHLHKNQDTFEGAVNIIEKGGAVLIFIEGLCLNTHHLLPYKKGTARIVELLQERHKQFEIQVVTLSYQDFHSISKNVLIVFQRLAKIPVINSAKDRLIFNEKVREIMEKGLFRLPNQKRSHGVLKWFFYPYYLLVKRYVSKKTNGTVFYDSVLFAVLFFTFPILAIALFFVTFYLI
jgi:1-acyl-sn-glycerol-3-phosphate acyltransferase